MTVALELPVIEMLFSKVFHDLVSPVGAVNNGAELLQEMGNEVLDDAIDLIGHSALRASRRLEFYRLAYGAAGTRDSVDVGTARKVAVNFYADTKVDVTWPAEINLSADLVPVGSIKILLNAVMAAADTLSHGGTVDVSVDIDGDHGTMKAVAKGDNATIKEDQLKALLGETSIADVDPHNVVAYGLNRFAEAYGFKLKSDQVNEGEFIVTLTW